MAVSQGASTILRILIVAAVTSNVLAASFDTSQPASSSFSNSENYRTAPAKRTRAVDAQPIQLCGFRLLDAVRVLCGGVFTGYTRRSDPAMSNAANVEEQSGNSIDSNSENAPQYAGGDGEMDSTSSDYSEIEPNWNRGSKSLLLKAEPKGHLRFRRNIIDECCKRPCTVNHMLKYCGRT